MPEGAELYALDKLPTSCIIHPELSTENWKLRRKIARVFFFFFDYQTSFVYKKKCVE